MSGNERKKELTNLYKERTVIGGVYAIKNTANGKILLLSAADLNSAKNRFGFAVATGGCIHPKLQNDWAQLGAEGFAFEIIEELKKKKDQSDKEFKEDLKALEELWTEKLESDKLY